jgi:glutamate formiminotransferase / 5-formyltetrahydrofolate cyclo-ligase
VSRIVLAVPNISEGRDTEKVALIAGQETLLDVHSDPDHNRSVLTYGGEPDRVIDACFAMIERAVAELDIGPHSGVHPRFGVVDVLPFVPYRIAENELRSLIAELIWKIDQGPSVPTFTYGGASPDRRSLPELRRELRDTPPTQHPTAGVICIGIRPLLIAFNVNCLGSLEDARKAARDLRSVPGIRALGLELPSGGEIQLSMNLIDLETTGPARAFERAIDVARDHSLQVIDCEVAGLVPQATRGEFRRLPLRWPVRTIEEALDMDSIGT